MDPEAERGLSQMTDRLERVEPRLSDLARERLLTRIHAELGAEIPPARHRRVPALAWAALVAAAAACFTWWAVDLRASRPVARKQAPVESPQHAATTPPRTLELVPYLFSGGSAQQADALLERAQTQIELGAGERVFATLDGRARLALVGPARLRVLRAQGTRVEIELSHGLLLGDYDHDQGGELIIASPGAQTQIVGTLFSVRALGNQSQVAVARGQVRVHAAGQRIEVGTGRAWSAERSTTEALSESAAAELALHERSLRPSAGARGVLGITGEKLEAEVGEQWLGATPLWAVVPAGSNTIALRDRGDRDRTVRSLRTVVRSAERTELVLEPSSSDDNRKPRSTRSEPSLAEPRIGAAERTNEPSAEDLYAAAERNMREGKLGRGAELLEELLVKFPTARNRDLAHYDLALAAYKQRDYAHAIAWLERLENQPMRPSLRELSAYLRCRAVHARTPDDAPACLEGFRRRFPNSPHAKESWDREKHERPFRE